MATTYVVMEKMVSGALNVLGEADGDTPREAVKAFVEPNGSEPVSGSYVAVPVRNWSEETSTVELRVKYESSGYTPLSDEVVADPQPDEEAEQLAASIEDDDLSDTGPLT